MNALNEIPFESKDIIKFVTNMGDDVFPPIPNIKLYFALWLYHQTGANDEANDIYAEFNELPSEKHTKAFEGLEHLYPSLAGSVISQLDDKTLESSLVDTVDIPDVMEASQVNIDKLKDILEDNQIDIFDTTVFLWIGSDDVKIYHSGREQLDSLLKTVSDRDIIWMVEEGDPSLI